MLFDVLSKLYIAKLHLTKNGSYPQINDEHGISCADQLSYYQISGNI
jgi:hypothetical protein